MKGGGLSFSKLSQGCVVTLCNALLLEGEILWFQFWFLSGGARPFRATCMLKSTGMSHCTAACRQYH